MPLALFKTGRTRTLVHSGVIVAGSDITTQCMPDNIVRVTAASTSYLDLQCLGYEFQITSKCTAKFNLLTCAASVGEESDAGNYITLFYNGTQVDHQELVTPTFAGPTTISTSCNGSWSVTCHVEEWCEVDDLGAIAPADVTAIDGTNFPSFGGGAQGDGIPAMACTFYERFVSGSNLVATGTVAGLTVSWTVAANPSFGPDYQIYGLAQAGSSGGSARECSSTFLLTGATSMGAVYSPSNSYGFADANNGVKAYTNGSSPGIWQCIMSIQAPKDYHLDSRGRLFLDPYVGGTQLALQDKARLSGGTWTASHVLYNLATDNSVDWQQREFEVYAANGPDSGHISAITGLAAHETCPVRVWLYNILDEDTRDWRCQILGKPYRAFSLAQAASTTVYAGGAFASPGGSFGPTVTNWEGYRYLQFTADQNASLVIGTKTFTWTVTTSGVAQTITLDLCSPSAWSVAALPNVDTRPSRFPLVIPSSTATGNDVDETTMVDAAKGVYWGVFKAATVSVTGVPATKTLHLGAVSLLRSVNSKATFLPKFLPDFFGWQSGTGVTYDFAPFATLESDGKQVADWPGMQHVLPGGGPNTFSYYTLTQLVALFNSTPGWTATLTGGYAADGWHDANGYALWAWGSGANWRGGYAGAWQNGVDVAVGGSTVDVYAQPLYDQVQGYPGIGDAWELTGYPAPGDSKALPVRTTKYLRGQAWGLVFKQSDGTPLAGTSVRAFDANPPNAFRGSGVADRQGRYCTGPPGGRGNILTVTELQTAEPKPSDRKPWANRWRVRDSFRGGGFETMPFLLQTEAGEMVLALVNATGDVEVKASPFTVPGGNPDGSWLVEAAVTTSHGWSVPRLCIDHRRRFELRARQGGAGIYGFTSDDFGATWSAPSLILMAAILCEIRCSALGTLLEMSFVPDAGTSGPGSFSARLRAPGDATFLAAFTPTDDLGAPLRCDGSGFGFDKAWEGADRWALAMVAVGESTVSHWYSSDGGLSWKRFAG